MGRRRSDPTRAASGLITHDETVSLIIQSIGRVRASHYASCQSVATRGVDHALIQPIGGVRARLLRVALVAARTPTVELKAAPDTAPSKTLPETNERIIYRLPAVLKRMARVEEWQVFYFVCLVHAMNFPIFI